MDLTHRLFGIRSCREALDGHRSRPCLEFDIKRCIAPCVESHLPDGGVRAGHRAHEALPRGAQRGTARRPAAADGRGGGRDERFEQAAQLRDAIRTRGDAARPQAEDGEPGAGGPRRRRREDGRRGGDGPRLPDARRARDRPRSNCRATSRRPSSTEAEVVEAALQQFYEVQPPPPEVHVPGVTGQRATGWRSGCPPRPAGASASSRRSGVRSAALLDLAMRNAALAYESRFNETGTAQYDALETLRATFGLPRLPRRIDCFDISTIQGSETVASMVVCEHGRMRRERVPEVPRAGRRQRRARGRTAGAGRLRGHGGGRRRVATARWPRRTGRGRTCC